MCVASPQSSHSRVLQTRVLPRKSAALSTFCTIKLSIPAETLRPLVLRQRGNSSIYYTYLFYIFYLWGGAVCATVLVWGSEGSREKQSSFSPSTCGFLWTELRSSRLVASTFATLLSQLAGPNSYILYLHTMNLRRHQAPLRLSASGVTMAEPRGIKLVQETGHALEDNTDKGAFVGRASGFLPSSPEDSRHSGQEWESRVECGPGL